MDILPHDVWPLIVSFMNAKTKRQMRLASIKWFNTIKYNKFKIFFARSANIQAIAERLSKYSWPIEIHFLKPKFDRPLDLINNLPIITNLKKISASDVDEIEDITADQWRQLSTLTNIEHWKLREEYLPQDLWLKFTKLTKWAVTLPEEELVPILKQMTNLNSLSLYSEDSKTWPFALTYSPDKLTRLDINVSEKQEHGSEMWARLTNLKALVYSENIDEGYNDIKLSFLTALKICQLDCKKLPSLARNTNLQHLSLHCQKWSTTKTHDLSNLKNLRILSIVYPHQQKPVQLNFLAHLLQLESFAIMASDMTTDVSNASDVLFQHLPYSLKRLKSDLYLDVVKITRLTNLEELTLYYTKNNNTNCINSQHLTALSNMTRLDVDQNNVLQDWKVIGKLTQLIELDLACTFDEDENVDDNIPDISSLTNLITLRWTLNEFPIHKLAAVAYLTKLEELLISAHNESDPSFINQSDFLSILTNLTRLSLQLKTSDNTLWQNMAKLTNIQSLSIHYVDHDDRLLTLTAFKNLTELTITSAAKEFTGQHFTALTNLQDIYFRGDSTQLVHKNEDLRKKMPYLLRYSYFVPLV